MPSEKPVSMVTSPVETSLSNKTYQLLALSDGKADSPGEEAEITILSQ